MILLNLDFIKDELTKNILPYLNEKHKILLLEKAELYNFNGTHFNSKSNLYEYLSDTVGTYDKEFIQKIDSKSRRTTESTLAKLYEVFTKETPLHINRDSLYKLMLLSSSLLFSPNEKICFTIILDNPYKEWTSDKIIEIAKKNYRLTLYKTIIEESLSRYIVSKDSIGPLLNYRTENKIKYYSIHFTNLIFYIRHFKKVKM